MNIQEKRRLEELIRAQIFKAKTAYKNRRDAERSEIVEKLEANTPKKIEGLIANYKTETERHKKAIASLEAEAKVYGYDIMDNHRGIYSEYSSDHPELKAHNVDTLAKIEAIENTADSFVLDVWSEKGEMQTLISRLAKELEKLTA